ncbi:MAG: DUF6240 domain-containing protein [Butyrivibrio sp.]|nr:DUF6240 domain-containing protein [Butyrivibrio sp.]
MGINFQTITGQKNRNEGIVPQMETYERPMGKTQGTGSVKKSGYSLELDPGRMSDNLYSGHTRSLEDISSMAGDTDVKLQHNYMALMSNTMSEEDYKKAMEDGFDLKDMNPDETVSIVDKIKGVLLTSGVEVVGYNDDISVDKLKKITGSEAAANAIKDSFSENDIPVTPQNVKEAKTALDQIAEIESLSDGAIKFMVENDMEPTIGNLYLSSHSTNGMNMMGRGFYAQDSKGYYAQKAEDVDLEQLSPQIDRVIDEAGLDKNDEKIRDNARWIITEGIPLTDKTLRKVTELKAIEFPVSLEDAGRAVASALVDGKKASDGNVATKESVIRRAEELVEKVSEINDKDLSGVMEDGKELNIRNLWNEHESSKGRADTPNEASKAIASDMADASGSDRSIQPESDRKLVAARLQLEEVRLRMSFDANKRLLDSGFEIDTAPMEELIGRLKKVLSRIDDETAGDIIDEVTGVGPSNANRVFEFTLSRIDIIKNAPAPLVGELDTELESRSLLSISKKAEDMTARFRQAGRDYEKLMTAPRADLGDSIKKAFRNIDDILKDLGEELNDENRRVIRILGHNSMEISKENIERVRSFDEKLQSTIGRLKPGAVFELIREGKNPLSMTIDELSQNLDRGQDSDSSKRGKSEERYARFLYKLEHKGDITEEERKSFIGIYRLFNTLRSTDYQAIGSLLETGRSMTVGNLLDATRNMKAKRRGMDYTIDDDFGGISLSDKKTGEKIDEQVSSAFRYYRAKAEEVYENLSPEKLKQANPGNDTLLPKLADDLKRAEEDQELDRAYVREQVESIRQTMSGKAAETAARDLKAADIAVTYNNVEAAISEKRDRRYGRIWDRLKDFKEVPDLKEKLSDDDYQNEYLKIMDDVSDKLSEELMTGDDKYIDVRAISLLQKQISVMGRGAENGSFEVPVEIDGQVVSMNVTLKSDAGSDSRMDASVWTDEYGLLTASLTAGDGQVRGMLMATRGRTSEGSEYLDKVRENLCERLSNMAEGIEAKSENISILFNAQVQPSSMRGEEAIATEGRKIEQTKTKTLLTMAKAFIEAL